MRRAPLWVVLSFCVVSSAAAQLPSPTTQTGVATKGAEKTFTFTPPFFGQVIATLSWDAQNAHLLMVLACGSGSDAESFGVAAGLLDRFARLESGVIPGEPCAIAVGTADETANFRLHLVRSGDQAVTATAVGSAALMPAREGSYLADVAVRALHRARVRALR
jgi:hypothetical protein